MSELIRFHGVALLQTSGDYIHTYQSVNGCDSVVTAHITINQALSSQFTAAACLTYTLPWGGAVTTSGDYLHTYQSVNGVIVWSLLISRSTRH
jgi:hypothetical protein